MAGGMNKIIKGFAGFWIVLSAHWVLTASAEGSRQNAEMIDGIPFVRLLHVVSYKQVRASEKDLSHVRALREAGINVQGVKS